MPIFEEQAARLAAMLFAHKAHGALRAAFVELVAPALKSAYESGKEAARNERED